MADFLKATTLSAFNRTIRSSSLITRMLFRVRVVSGPRIHWDFTTIALKRSLRRYTQPGDSVLEIGTGPYALLSLYLARRKIRSLLANDINQHYVNHARRTAAFNALKLEVVCGDLFETVNGTFDVIFFNAVYIPRGTGERLGLNHLHSWETDWCGGSDGLETISAFLHQAPAYLNPGGYVLLGFNPHYLPLAAIMDRCLQNDYQYTLEANSRLNPSRVLILRFSKEKPR
ncbi:MAG: hypothetical protein C4524_00390 [Candidatus Zixiibacteriota bacterium]|nr:MAG: hypothetical protein C4524_00390 [candidate division Zixibacteria bacterium]